jgi:hypothetical protein
MSVRPTIYEVEEGLVDAGIVREFGMESGGHGSSLPDGDRICAFGGHDLNAFSDVLDLGGADEDHFERRTFEVPLNQSAFADGAVDLASVGVAADADVERAQPFLMRIFYFGGQQDRARAGAESRLGVDKLLQLLESCVAEKLQKCAGLPAGDHQAVDVVELLGLLDQHNFRAQLLEPAAVGVEIALQSEDSNFHTDLILLI